MNVAIAVEELRKSIGRTHAHAGPGVLTADRLWSLAGALLSLAGAVAGGLAPARAARRPAA
ncbi:hypothetical protein [Nonomuraea sp. NPDC003214]